jgi:hypothetical protein
MGKNSLGDRLPILPALEFGGASPTLRLKIVDVEIQFWYYGTWYWQEIFYEVSADVHLQVDVLKISGVPVCGWGIP